MAPLLEREPMVHGFIMQTQYRADFSLVELCVRAARIERKKTLEEGRACPPWLNCFKSGSNNLVP